jgi:MATE family multidrug resistance protein
MDHKPGAAVHEPLLPSPPQGKAAASAEAKRLMRLAGPIVASCVLQNVVNMASVMFVGHLGELPLAGASLATSLANVTGYSLLVRPPTDPIHFFPPPPVSIY